jgi:hypothetical protein
MGGRITGRVAQAIRAEATLLAASPAYSKGSGYTYQQAADYAATVIDAWAASAVWLLTVIHGTPIPRRLPILHQVPTPRKSSGVAVHPRTTIWKPTTSTDALWQGQVDPTQNLVDAFPMVNGYPISDSRSGYDDTDPYYGRDPALPLTWCMTEVHRDLRARSSRQALTAQPPTTS